LAIIILKKAAEKKESNRTWSKKDFSILKYGQDYLLAAEARLFLT